MPVTGWHVEQRRGGGRINEGRRLEHPAECVTTRFNRWQIKPAPDGERDEP